MANLLLDLHDALPAVDPDCPAKIAKALESIAHLPVDRERGIYADDTETYTFFVFGPTNGNHRDRQILRLALDHMEAEVVERYYPSRLDERWCIQCEADGGLTVFESLIAIITAWKVGRQITQLAGDDPEIYFGLMR